MVLTDRQEVLLALIVHEFTDTAEPVGSTHLVEKYNLGVSSATVRNEMMALSDAGLLRQPHTSAGRIPTEDGFRYYVRQLLRDTELPAADKRMVSHQFHQARGDVDGWARLAASVLAQQSRVASLVSEPHAAHSVFKHLELIFTQGRQVLLVLVLQGGDVRQQMLALPEVIEQQELSRIAEEISRLCSGKDAHGLVQNAGHLTGLSSQIVGLIIELMAHSDSLATGEIFRDGISNVLNQPEFADAQKARHALRLLEESRLLEQVLEGVLAPTSVGGVQVVIGGEGTWEELENCSMVVARYGAPGYATGALGVLGPTRMAYGRSISAVRYVASLMSDLVLETFAG